jgi:hypothetical protein
MTDSFEGSAREHHETRRYALVPQELRDRPQWVGYRRSVRPRRNKPDEIVKKPVNASAGIICDATDPAMWSSFDDAVAGARRHHLDGIGFCFSSDDPYCGVDLDHCRDPETGDVKTWARELVGLLDSFAEVSPSGCGVHVIIKALLPANAGHKRRHDDGVVEVYSEGRYFTVTGEALDDTPLLILERQAQLDQLRQIVWGEKGHTGGLVIDADSDIAPPTCGVTTLSDEEILAHCRSDAKGATFRAFYDEGDLSDCDDDDSRADFFVWSKLAFYIGDDPERIARLAEGGAHYLRLDDPTEASARRHKWQRPYAPYGTFQQRQIAVVLAGRGPEQVFGGGVQHGETRGARETQSPQSSGERAKAWPEPLASAGFYGVLGDIARGIEPYIEADPAALLINLIVASGIAIGRESHLQVGAAQHRAVLNAITVGETGDNKSDATTPLRAILAHAEVGAADGVYEVIGISPTLSGGLSTGEGLLWQVRDERREHRENKKAHLVEEVVVDPGVTDKRLLVLEAEFARVLAVMYREGNTLSTVFRDLFDSPEQAKSSPKNSPVVATAPHIGLIGQITPAELSRKLHETELYNGFVSRFLWVLTHRVKSLPAPPDYSEMVQEHARRWREAIRLSRKVTTISRDHDAGVQWGKVYETLRSGERERLPPRQGLALDACARAHVMVLRIALIFAALDGSSVITIAHQDAALAIWEYSERCAAYLFGDLAGDPVENVIADALRQSGRMRREELRALFSRHLPAAALQVALDALERAGKVHQTKEQTAGRPVEFWNWATA